MNPMDEQSSLDSLEIGPRGRNGEPPRRVRGRSLWIWLLVALLLLAAILYFFWWRPRSQPVAAPPDPGIADAGREFEADSEQPAPRGALPRLEASDPVVRQLLDALTDHPALVALLAPEGLVRRFVAAVDNIADGVSPRPHLDYLQPKAGFHAEMQAGKLVATSESYRRYDRWVRLFASFDVAEIADLYAHLEPLFDQAYAELGYPRADFRDTLLRAIDRLCATPEVPEDEPLIETISAYAYRDPELESLGPVEKQLARMGPANARQVKAQLQRIRSALVAEAADPEREG